VPGKRIGTILPATPPDRVAGATPLRMRSHERLRERSAGVQPMVLLTMSDNALSTPALVTALMAKYQVPCPRLSIT
jgi:hypothetical protein